MNFTDSHTFFLEIVIIKEFISCRYSILYSYTELLLNIFYENFAEKKHKNKNRNRQSLKVNIYVGIYVYNGYMDARKYRLRVNGNAQKKKNKYAQ